MFKSLGQPRAFAPRVHLLICALHSYYIVRHGNVSVPDMYNFHGMYRYSPKFATNWRALVAFFIGCLPPLPGFIDNIVKAGGGTTTVSEGGQHL
jgi:nucleobase:cation symporter-1, NCS1 family